MGLKASPTCVMRYENCTAYRIGDLHRGFNAMFTMVNTMRLEVALQGVAIGGAATTRIEYATERPQGGDPERAPVAISEHPDVRRMLLECAPASSRCAHWCSKPRGISISPPPRRTRRRARRRGARRMAAADRQGVWDRRRVRGCEPGRAGLRWTGLRQRRRRRTVRARHPRRIDLRGHQRDPGARPRDPQARQRRASAATCLRRVRADLERLAGSAELGRIHAAVREACQARSLHAAHGGAQRTAPRDAAAGATAYLRLAGLVACGWMWLRMAAAANGDTAFARGKRAAAEFFAEQVMPEAAVLETQACPAQRRSTRCRRTRAVVNPPDRR